MLMSVSRLLIVSSLSLLFALFVTHIPRIFVLETVKALSVLGKGDSRSIFFCGESEGQTPSEYTMVSVRVNMSCIFFLPMKAQIVSLRHHAHWLGASDKVRKCVLF